MRGYATVCQRREKGREKLADRTKSSGIDAGQFVGSPHLT